MKLKILDIDEFAPIEENDYSIKLLDGDFYVGEYVTVQTSDGKIYKRKVFDSKDDLCITISGCKYYYSDLI